MIERSCVMERFADRRVIVTGAGSGIGQSTVARVLDEGATGTFLMTRQALPALMASGRGVVVNFTSTAASFAHPYMAAYAASKGGVLSFTHALALEYSKQGLRAVNIQPGGVATALATSTLDKMPEGYDLGLWAKQTPLLHGRENEILGDPSSVAAVIAMVASDDRAFITGTEIQIDGGAHA